MPIEEIASSIISDAKKKIKGIEADAAAQSSDILASAREQAKHIVEQAKKEAQEKASAILSEHMSEFEVQKHNEILLAQELAVEKELASARRLFIKKLAGEYKNMLKHAAEAMERSSGGFIVEAESKYIKLIKGIGYDAKQIADGIFVRSPDGSATIDLSPENLFKQNAEFIKSRISLSLFYKTAEASAMKKTSSIKVKHVRKHAKRR